MGCNAAIGQLENALDLRGEAIHPHSKLPCSNPGPVRANTVWTLTLRPPGSPPLCQEPPWEEGKGA